MNKLFLSLISPVCLAAGLSACQTGPTQPEPTPSATVVISTPTPLTPEQNNQNNQATQPSNPTTPTPEPDVSASLPPLPTGLPGIVDGYRGWFRLNAEPLPPRADAPHGSGIKHVYVNQALSDLQLNGQPRYPYPTGTVIVKEGLHSQGHLELIAVMQKIAGADPEHGDWVFEEYTRSATDVPFRRAFSGSICWDCHNRARDTDWAFTPIP